MARNGAIIMALLLSCLFASIVSLMVGAVAVAPSVVINTLFDLDGAQQGFIINRSRVPRLIIALITGGALALSGTIIQAILRNALASPKIIGINSGAAAAILLSVLLLPDLPGGWKPLIAAAGGIVAAVIVWLLAELRSLSPARLALIGVALAFTGDAIVDYILVTADTYDISAPLLWLTGSLWARGWDQVWLILPVLPPLMLICLFLGFRLNLLRLGALQAGALGMHVRRERLLLLTLATLLAALSVSVVGMLGFVGLAAPHMARRLVGGNHRILLPTAMLIGALIVTVADALGRAVLPPIEISAGILTAGFGAPFFIYLLLTSRTEAKE